MVRSLIPIAAVLGCVAPLHAEPTPLDVDPDEEWVHAATGLRLPASIRDMSRDRIVSYLAGENNIGATYFSQEDNEILSIYAYRSGSYDVAMMADAAIAAISANDRLGSIDQGSAIFSTFGGPAIGKDSGVSSAFRLDGEYRSTGLALFQNGNWLVKVRYSSKIIDAETLGRRLVMLAAGLPMDVADSMAPPAYKIGDCGDLPPRPRIARRKLELTDWIIATTAVSVRYDETIEQEVQNKIAPQEASRVCRDRASKPGLMLYRDLESDHPRSIVFGDSGTVAYLGAAMLSLDESSTKPIMLSLGNGMRTQFYDGFESTPGFEQMLQALDSGPVQASVQRTEEGSQITLHTKE